MKNIEQFIAPIWEEFSSRYFLRPTNKNRIIFLIGIFLFMLFFLLLGGGVSLYFSVVLLGIYFLLYLKFRYNKIAFYRWYIKYFKFIFYISALVFGLLHINNLDFPGYAVIVLPIMVLPQIFSGLLLGFMRMKYGFIYSVLLHMSFNIIFSIHLLIKG